MTLHLCHAPLLRVSCISNRFAEAFVSAGIDARCHTIGCEGLVALMHKVFSDKIVGRIESHLVTPRFNRRLLATIKKNDIVWIYTDASLINPKRDARLESEFKRRGARYIFHLPDAWPLSNRVVAEACARRMKIADLTVAVTPRLTRLITQRYPEAAVETGEEAIDTDLIAPPRNMPDGLSNARKIIAWNAPPRKLGELEKLVPILEAVYRRVPFDFRVITGEKIPKIAFSFPWEWLPYNKKDPSANFAGVDAAIAYYGSKPYYECKGNYKVKTFMSMGLPVVTSRIGYNKDLIQDGVNGILVSTNEEWVDALVWMLSNPDKARGMGLEARKSIVDRYSYSTIAKCYIEILSKHFPECFDTSM